MNGLPKIDLIFTDYWLSPRILPDGLTKVSLCGLPEDDLDVLDVENENNIINKEDETDQLSTEEKEIDEKIKLKDLVHEIIKKRNEKNFSPLQSLFSSSTDDENASVPYANLRVDITNGLVELVNLPYLEADQGPPKTAAETTKPVHQPPSGISSCCDTRVDGSEIKINKTNKDGQIDALGEPVTRIDPSAVPPLFVLVRVFLNDIPIMQTQLATLSDNIPPAFPPAQTSHPSEIDSSIQTEEIREPDRKFGLFWNTSADISLDTPGDILTLQLIDKDFCPDLGMSEDVLASVSVPVAAIRAEKKYNLLLNVACSLPTSLSLGTLLLAADKAASDIDIDKNKTRKNMTKLQQLSVTDLSEIITVSPAVLKCRVRFSLFLKPKGSPVFLSEFASLALAPTSPLSAVSLGTSLHSSESRTAAYMSPSLAKIIGSLQNYKNNNHDGNAVVSYAQPISVLAILNLFGQLIAILGVAGTRTATAELFRMAVSEKKKDQYFSLDEKNLTAAEIAQKRVQNESERSNQSSGIDYSLLVSHFLFVSTCFVFGPLQKAKTFFEDLVRLKHPILSGFILLAVWVQIVIPFRLQLPCWIFTIAYSIFCLSYVHVARPPPSKSDSSETSEDLIVQSVESAKSILSSLESSIIKGSLQLRLQVLDIWMAEMNLLLKEHPLNQPDAKVVFSVVNRQFLKSNLFFLSVILACISILFPSNFLTLLVALSVSLLLFQRTRILNIIMKFWTGLSRYRQLQKLRRTCSIPVSK